MSDERAIELLDLLILLQKEIVLMNATIQAQLDRLTAADTKIEAKLAALQSQSGAAGDAADAATSAALEPVVAKVEADAS